MVLQRGLCDGFLKLVWEDLACSTDLPVWTSPVGNMEAL